VIFAAVDPECCEHLGVDLELRPGPQVELRSELHAGVSGRLGILADIDPGAGPGACRLVE
jgi:hypothetical protein